MITHTTFQGKLTPDVLETVVRVETPNENPLYATILGANQVLPAKAQEVSWYTTSAANRRTQVNGAGLVAATTTIPVDDTAAFLGGDILIAEATGELMRVQSVNSGVSIVVVRGIGGVAAADASVADNAWLMNIGNAFGEGAKSPPDAAASKVKAFNFLQTFRQAVRISGRMNRVETMTEEERAFQRIEAFKEVTRDIEHAMVFGGRNDSLTDADGNAVTTMGGLREMVTTHITNQGGTMSEDQLNAFAAEAFDTGSSIKLFAVGSILMDTLHKLWRDRLRINTTIARVGLRITAIDTPHGTWNLVKHPGLRGAFAGDGISVDIDQLKLRPTEKNGGGRLQLKTNTQDNGEDSVREEIFAEHTLDFGAEQNHAQLRGVTGAA